MSLPEKIFLALAIAGFCYTIALIVDLAVHYTLKFFDWRRRHRRQ